MAYMPAPTGASLNAVLSPASRTASGDAIMPGRSARSWRTARGVGSARSISTVRSSTASTPSTAASMPVMLESGSLIARSRLKATASASNGVPSWKVTSSRKVSATDCSSASHSVARRGSSDPSSGDTETSVSNTACSGA